jgi:hypothetical protein
MQWRAQLERGELSRAQFVAWVQQTRAQDPAGNWWTIDPQTGRYLTFRSNQWVPAQPPATPSAATPAQQRPATPSTATSSTPAKSSGLRGCLGSPLMVGLLSFGSALVWFAYTSLSPSSEGNDFRTPLIIAGAPLLLRLLQKPLDGILSPLYKLLGKIPRPLLAGAALALPLVIGGLLTDKNGSGFGAVQSSAFFSIVLGYVLTRRPGVLR